jgi:hypothetical protein
MTAPKGPQIQIRATHEPVWLVGGTIRSMYVSKDATLALHHVTVLGPKAKMPPAREHTVAEMRAPFVMKSAPWYERLFTAVPWEDVHLAATEIKWALRRLATRS